MLRFAVLEKGRGAEIGREAGSDLMLSDASVSRKHARVTFESGEFRVKDLGSRNGTRVNGEPANATPLRPGDRLETGTVLLRYDLVTPHELSHLRGVMARLAASDRDPLTGLLTRA